MRIRGRGRPRHDDVLTPREWDVLVLLRQGLTNQEIAERLDISLNGAKYHVSNILGKLGVDSREDAAALAVAQRRRGLIPALFAGIELRLTLAQKAAPVALATAAMVVIVLAWGRSNETPQLGSAGDQLTPTPASPADSYEAVWTPASPPLFEGEEHEHPFAAEFPDIPAERMRWSLQIASLDGGEPQVLFETARWLSQPVWAEDGPVGVRYQTRAAVPIERLRDEVVGYLRFDPENPSAPPKEAGFDTSSLSGIWPSPDLSKVLLLIRGGIAGSGDFLLLDVDSSQTRLLTGLPGRLSTGSADWSPDSAHVVLAVIEEEPAASRDPVPLFAVPTAGGTAHKVTHASVFRAAWSPEDSNLLAYVDENDALWLFDARGGHSQRLTPDGSVAIGQPSFHNDGRVRVENRLIDPASGEETVYDMPLSPDNLFTLEIAPDGRRAVAADTFQGETDVCDAIGRPPQNHVFLYEAASGETSTLKDCDGRNFIFFDWLADNVHVTMTGAECFACESVNRSVVLKDVDTGAETHLTDGYEFGASVYVSPDGERVLVTGNSLRVYDNQGALLRRIEPPFGFSVTWAAWSPDGRRFTYVVGPTGVWSL